MMVRHVTENLGLSKIALMVPNAEYGLGLLSGTETSAAESGVEIVATEMYVPNQDKDFSVQLAKIKQAEPEAMLILGDYNEAGLIIKQMDAAGMDMPIVTTASCSNQIMIDLAGADAAEGVFMLGYWDPELPEDIVQNFVKACGEQHDGAVPDERNAYGYEIPYICLLYTSRCV